MYIIRLTFIQESYNIFKRIIETIMEATEIAKFIFLPNNILVISSIESYAVCQTQTQFSNKCFSEISIREHVSINVDLKELHDFLRKGKNQKTVSFVMENNRVLKLLLDTEELVLNNHIDKDHESISNEYLTWPSFSINANEFNNIILDHCVSGKEVNVIMYPNSNVIILSKFDEGIVEHKSFNTDKNNIVRVHNVPLNIWESGEYLIKYFKLICSLTSLTDNVIIFIQEHGKLILKLTDHKNFIDFTFSIIEYKGPYGHKVPEEYLSYAKRIT